jgi:frataxin-like iron-binding protein CyaY
MKHISDMIGESSVDLQFDAKIDGPWLGVKLLSLSKIEINKKIDRMEKYFASKKNE